MKILLSCYFCISLKPGSLNDVPQIAQLVNVPSVGWVLINSNAKLFRISRGL